MAEKFFKDNDSVGRTLGDKLMRRAQDTDDFRTVMYDTPEGQVMLKTKGGTPELSIKRKEVVEATPPCVAMPMKEIDSTGAETQDSRLYYHNNIDFVDTPERRVFSSDGMFSMPVTPLKRIYFESTPLNKKFDVWLNDQTVPHTHVPTSSVSLVQVTRDVPSALPGVLALEQLRGDSAPYMYDELVFEDDPTATLCRRYYSPSLLTSDVPKAEEDPADYKGFAFLIARLKKIVFDLTGFGARDGKYTIWFRAYSNLHRSEVIPVGSSGANIETGMLARTYSGSEGSTTLTQIPFPSGAITIAAPGGVLQPAQKTGYASGVKPREYLLNAANVGSWGRADDLNTVVTFGQHWHGLLNPTTGEIFSTEEQSITTINPTTYAPGAYKYSAQYVNLFGRVAKDTLIQPNAKFRTRAEADYAKLPQYAVLLNGNYFPTTTTSKFFGFRQVGDSYVMQFPIRNSDGTTHLIAASINRLSSLLTITAVRRLDTDFFYQKTPYTAYTVASVMTNTVVPDLAPLFSGVGGASADYVVGYRHDYSQARGVLLRHSPNGRKLFLGGVLVELSGNAGADLSASFSAGPYPMVKSVMDSLGPNNTFYDSYRMDTGGPWTQSSSVNGVPESVSGGSGTWSASRTHVGNIWTVNISIDHTAKVFIRSFTGVLLDMVFNEETDRFEPVEAVGITETVFSYRLEAQCSNTTESPLPPTIFFSTLRVTRNMHSNYQLHIYNNREQVDSITYLDPAPPGSLVYDASAENIVYWGTYINGTLIPQITTHINSSELSYTATYSRIFANAGNIVEHGKDISLFDPSQVQGMNVPPVVYRTSLIGPWNGGNPSIQAFDGKIRYGAQSVTPSASEQVHFDCRKNSIGLNTVGARIFI